MNNLEQEYKDTVISKILLATISSPIDARKIYEDLNLFEKRGMGIEVWQRAVTRIVEAYQYEQFRKAINGESFNYILSCPSGYFQSSSLEDSKIGRSFHIKRIKPIIERAKVLNKCSKLKYENNQTELFIKKEQPGQTSLAL